VIADVLALITKGPVAIWITIDEEMPFAVIVSSTDGSAATDAVMENDAEVAEPAPTVVLAGTVTPVARPSPNGSLTLKETTVVLPAASLSERVAAERVPLQNGNADTCKLDGYGGGGGGGGGGVGMVIDVGAESHPYAPGRTALIQAAWDGKETGLHTQPRSVSVAPTARPLRIS
jgi:hypothetical protein